MSINMAAHLREPKHTCLGRTGASVTSPAHLPEIPSSQVSNSANSPNTAVVSPSVRVLEAVRQLAAAWEQHNRFISRLEDPEEFAARMAARDALRHLEDCAQWLEAEMGLEKI